MKQKLIITESQFKKLKSLLLETEYKAMINKKIEKDDIVKIIDGEDKTWSFKVTLKQGVKIFMDNVDKGTEFDGKKFFMTNNSLKDKDLTLKTPKDEKQRNSTNTNTWDRVTLNNIKNIIISRGNKFVDSVFDTNEASYDSEEYDDVNEKLLYLLKNVEVGKELTIIMSDGREIIGCCIYNNKATKEYYFNIKENGNLLNEEAKKFILTLEKTVGDDDLRTPLELNQEFWSSSDKGVTLDTKIELIIEGTDEEVKIELKGISGFRIESCSDDSGDDSGDSGSDETKDEPIDGIDDSTEEYMDDLFDDESISKPTKRSVLSLYNKIKKDKEFMNAQIKNPSLLKLLMGAITGKDVKTKGNIAVLNSLSSFFDNRITDKLGENFDENKKVFFEPIDTIILDYKNVRGADKEFKLLAGEEYRHEEAVTVRSYSIDDLKYGEYRILDNSRYKFRIIVKEKIEDDVFLCDVEKFYTYLDKPKKSKKEDVRIKLLSSPGYRTDTV